VRILVNDIAASVGGALTILRNFYEFAKCDKKNEYIFLLSGNYIEETNNVKVIIMPEKKRWLKRLVFDLFVGRRYIKQFNIDAIISLQNTIIFGTKIKQILYVHQSIPFQSYKKFSLIKVKERTLAIVQYFIGYIIKKSIKKADSIVVQTEWMKEEIINRTGKDVKEILVLRPSFDFTNESKDNINLETNKFFYPANNEIYKNHECIYKACKILEDKGINNYEVILTIDESNNENKLKNIRFSGRLKAEKVIEMYSKSILLFPSYIESLALPLLEARNEKTIILASDCKFSRELLSDYENAYFFDPFKCEELADLMEKCITGDIVLKEVKKIDVIYQQGWEELIKLV